MEMTATQRRATGETQSNGGAPVASRGDKPVASEGSREAIAERTERDSLVLWYSPISTLIYFFKEVNICLKDLWKTIREHIRIISLLLVFIVFLLEVDRLPGPHVTAVMWARKKIFWSLYWLVLGVMSSVGLGTGLHTFLLYLGPHIAQVTLAAYECGGLNFPEPPYPDEITCPVKVDPKYGVNLWNILMKVWLEAMMWGVGTAVGELPPYYMARTARLSGYDPEDEDDLREFEEFQRKKTEEPESLTWIDRLKILVEDMVEKVGFFGILACASIPNPLFDLAGITCGHFLVPFWKFFGATLIGKAGIKMMIQTLFVIVAFNEELIEKAVDKLSVIPVMGKTLQQPVIQFFANQKARFHRNKGESPVKEPPPSAVRYFSIAFEVMFISMILFFVISIVNSFAQRYHKRLCKERRAQKER